MDTRVLTLFDDEDYLQPEEPKKKPKKEVPAKEEIKETAAVQQDERATDITSHEVNHTTENEPGLPEETPAVNGTQEIIDEPKNSVPEIIAEVTEEEVLPEDEQLPDDEIQEEEPALLNEKALPEAEEKRDEEAIAADEELNKQIISELIQTDYTALIHRDYPFEVNQASVVQPKKNAVEKKQAEEDGELTEDDEVFEDIVPLPEWNLDKNYYSIGEVASLFAVNTSHIRFWTNEFKIKPRTTRKGDRLYSPKDIAELRLIHHLVKEKKHTIKGAKEKLKAGKEEVNNKLDLKDSLIGLRDTLLQIKAQL